jgi:hypothetical protein
MVTLPEIPVAPPPRNGLIVVLRLTGTRLSILVLPDHGVGQGAAIDGGQRPISTSSRMMTWLICGTLV